MLTRGQKPVTGCPKPLSQSKAWCAFVHQKCVSFARDENSISQEKMSTTTRFENEPRRKLGNHLLQRHNRPFARLFFLTFDMDKFRKIRRHH